jgi:hypothetical protein
MIANDSKNSRCERQNSKRQHIARAIGNQTIQQSNLNGFGHFHRDFNSSFKFAQTTALFTFGFGLAATTRGVGRAWGGILLLSLAETAAFREEFAGLNKVIE